MSVKVVLASILVLFSFNLSFNAIKKGDKLIPAGDCAGTSLGGDLLPGLHPLQTHTT